MSIVNEATDDVPGIKHPLVRSQRFIPREPLDWIWTAAVAALGLIITSVVNNAGFGWLTSLLIIPLAGVWAFSMYTPESSKYNERIYQIPVTIIKDIRLRMNRGEVYRSEQSIKAEMRISAEEKEKEQRAKLEGVPYKRVPVNVESITATEIGNFEIGPEERRRVAKVFPLEVRGFAVSKDANIGLIYNKSKMTYSMVFTADGSKVRDASRKSQYNTIMRYAGLIKKATATAGLRGLNVSMGIRNRPQDQWLIPETMLEVGDLDVILPEALINEKPTDEYTLDDKMDIELNELLADFAELGVQSYSVDMMVVITVKENDALRKAYKDATMSEKDYRRLPIVRIQNVILPTLNRIVGGGVEILDVEGAERYLRKALDVSTLFYFYGDAEETKVLKRERVEAGIEEVVDYSKFNRYLPKGHIISTNTSLNVDGTFGSVLDMTTFPKGELYAHDMPALTDAESRWSSFSVIGQTVRSGLEYTVTNGARGLFSDLADRFGIIVTGPRADRKAGEQYDRLTEMDNAGVNQNFVVRFAALETSADALEQQLALDVDRFNGIGLGPVQVTCPSQQWLKFLSTVTLIDCE